MKKTIISIVCVLLAIGLLAGCSDSKGAAEATTQSQVPDTAAGYKTYLNEDGTLKDIKASDYVTVCDYHPITLKKSDVSVEDAEVDAQIDQIMSQYTTTEQVKDRAIKKGDTANIDFTGKIDGKEFENGKGTGYDLVIGSNSFIDDFEEQLIGLKPGEEKTVKVTFPDDYPAEAYRGKDAEFDVKVNYISVQKEQKLTDNFVKENFSDKYSSVKDMKKKIKEDLEKQKTRTFVEQYIHDKSKFKEIPKDLVNKAFDGELGMIKAQVAGSGGSFEDYLKSTGYESEEALREQNYAAMEDMVKMHLIYDAVAEKEKIKATEDDIKELTKADDISQYVEVYSLNYMNRMALNNKVLEFLCDDVETK